MEEATRQFWQRTLGMDADAVLDYTPLNDTSITQRQPQYPVNLRPTIRVLTRLCEQVISDEQGTYVNIYSLTASDAATPRQQIHDAIHECWDGICSIS